MFTAAQAAQKGTRSVLTGSTSFTAAQAAQKKTDEPMAPLHDEFSHGADMFRYIGQAVDLMTNAAIGEYQEAPAPVYY